jgi:YihY family inner membrane protein
VELRRRLERFDAVQQSRPALSIVVATLRKFVDDQTMRLASMMAFWAFFSLFPLLLAFVTLLGYVVPDTEKQRTLEAVAGYVPLLDVDTISGLDGSIPALVLGFGSALWSGSAVVRTTQYAFNLVWEVTDRPKLGEQVRRSLIAMSTIGLGLVSSTLLIGFLAGDNPYIEPGPAGRVLGFALTVAFDIGLFIAAFRILTDGSVSTRDVLPGACLSGLTFWLLKAASSVIIAKYLTEAEPTYGTFATVITILWWLYLQSIIILLGAQLNVVLKLRLYPRKLLEPAPVPA